MTPSPDVARCFCNHATNPPKYAACSGRDCKDNATARPVEARRQYHFASHAIVSSPSCVDEELHTSTLYLLYSTLGYSVSVQFVHLLAQAWPRFHRAPPACAPVALALTETSLSHLGWQEGGLPQSTSMDYHPVCRRLTCSRGLGNCSKNSHRAVVSGITG